MMESWHYRNVRDYLLLVSLILGLTACFGSDVTKQESLFWPAPPDEPRFVFEGSLRDRDAIKKKSNQELLFDAVTGKRNKTIFNKPYDVAASGGKIVVTDTVFKHALMFDVPRRRLFRFGVRNDGVLEKPLGVAMDAQQFVYIADGSANIVKVYDSLGLFQRYVGEKGDFVKPVDVAVRADGNRIYVVDAGGLYSESHGFVIFDKEGNKLREVRSRGAGESQFNLPNQAAVAPDGTLYVLDAGNFRVQAFSSEGDYLRSWGKAGRKLGEFARPRGIGVDTDGNVYVTDAQFRNFQIFSPEGELLMFIGGGDNLEDEPGQYVLPAGITVDETNRVYVVDQILLKVEVIRRLDASGLPQQVLSVTGAEGAESVTIDADVAEAEQTAEKAQPSVSEASIIETELSPEENAEASSETLRPENPEVDVDASIPEPNTPSVTIIK